jgi:hypothetical protein
MHLKEEHRMNVILLSRIPQIRGNISCRHTDTLSKPRSCVALEAGAILIPAILQGPCHSKMHFH